MLYLLKIVHIFAKHDGLGLVRRVWLFRILRWIYPSKNSLKDEVKFTNAVKELGPAFIKMGQALSLRPDIIGQEYATALSKLQDSLDPFDTEQARAIIESELKGKVEDLFESFDDTPIAAASIAQVHYAVSNDGTKVAVKLLRPDIEETFSRDIKLFFLISRIAPKLKKRFRKKLELMRLDELVSDFEAQSKRELNLTYEAACASELKNNLKTISDIVTIPDVDWDRTSQRVLTTTRLIGVKINDKAALAQQGISGKSLVPKLAKLYFEQVYENGYFHADLHPGNIFVLEDGKLGLVDFGIMGHITQKEKRFVATIAYSYLNRDYQKAADTYFEAGYVPANQDRKILALYLRAIGEPIYGTPEQEGSIAWILGETLKVTEQFEMQTQPQLILLQKTMVYMEGLVVVLDENENFWVHCHPLLIDWAKRNLSYRALPNELKQELRQFTANVKKLNDTLPHIIDTLESAGARYAHDVQNQSGA